MFCRVYHYYYLHARLGIVNQIVMMLFVIPSHRIQKNRVDTIVDSTPTMRHARCVGRNFYRFVYSGVEIVRQETYDLLQWGGNTLRHLSL